jgi:hypothetical protein
MTVQELYKRFLLMLNKNDTNEGINIAPGVFVLLYNSEMLRWLDEELKKDEDNIDVNKIEFLYQGDFPVVPSGPPDKRKKFIEFTLPVDFFQLYGSYSYADKGDCKGVIIWNWEKKPGENIAARSDENSKPSFDYQEAPFVVGADKMKIYFDDYIVKDTFINYYRTARKIDIKGYIHFDGTASVNIDPELDDDLTMEILERTVLEVTREIVDAEGFQLAKDRKDEKY